MAFKNKVIDDMVRIMRRYSITPNELQERINERTKEFQNKESDYKQRETK